jgi:hypothetical protein
MIATTRTGSGFRGLSAYLATGHDGQKHERVAWTDVRNLPPADHRLTATMMRATANLSKRCQKPVYHITVSWPEAERLPREQMLTVADRLIGDLGLAEHQAVIVCHNDTDHPHLHIMVNRVHPETGKAWSTSMDYKRVEESLRRLEHELGLQQVPGRHTDPERAQEPHRRPEPGSEREMDAWSREELKGIRSKLGRAFTEAKSWGELRVKLFQHRLELREKGQGFIVTDGRGFAKLSQFGKTARKDLLEQRFGQSWEEWLASRDTPDPRETAREQAEERLSQAEASLGFFQHTLATVRVLGQRLTQSRDQLQRVEASGFQAKAQLDAQVAAHRATLAKVYRNPAQAMKALAKAEATDSDIGKLPLDSVGKLRGWAFWGFRSKARREAEEAAKGLIEERTQLRRTKGHLAIVETDWRNTTARVAATDRALRDAQALLGDPQTLAERHAKLMAERDAAKATMLAIEGTKTPPTPEKVHEPEERALSPYERLQRARERDREPPRDRGPER